MGMNPLLDLLNPIEEYKFDPETWVELISKENGNELSIKGRHIYLQLETEAKVRRIGTIDSKKTTVWLHRIREKHIHRVSSCYGFNYRLFRDLPEIKNIILQDDIERFNIPVEVIRRGKIMHFKDAADGNEYELQFYVHISILKRYTES